VHTKFYTVNLIYVAMFSRSVPTSFAQTSYVFEVAIY